MGGEILDTDRRGYVSIQILRGIAATLVVLYHILGASRLIVASDNHPLAAGVDIFFVISGFVMVVSTEGRSMSGGAFLRARLQRIVPLYWIALIMAFALIAARVIDRPLPLPSEVLRSFLFVFSAIISTDSPIRILASAGR